jgi:hypothetical protein
MFIDRSYRTAVALAGGLVVLLVAAALLLAGRGAAEPEPTIISAHDPDTAEPVVTPEAVGMCALNRRSGALEGTIVGVADGVPAGEPHFVVRSLDGTGREYRIRSAAVHIDLCERALVTTPSATPIRMETGS